MSKRKIGSKYWADSYVILKNGTKIYLENFLDDLEYQMASDSKTVKAEISNKYSTIIIKKKDISTYGEVF